MTTLAIAGAILLGRPLLAGLLRPPPLDTSPAADTERLTERFSVTMATILQHRGAELELRAAVATATGRTDGERIDFTRLVAHLFRNHGRTTIRGHRGSWQAASQILTIEGDATVKTDSFTGTAPAMIYRAAEDMVVADGPVFLSGGPFSVTGHNLHYELASGRLRLGNGGRVFFEARPDRGG